MPTVAWNRANPANYRVHNGSPGVTMDNAYPGQGPTPPGYSAVGPTRPSGANFREYLEAKARGGYDPGYADWVNGVGRVSRNG